MSRAILPLAALCACAGPSTEPSRGRPNVIVIVTDDQGFGDLGFHGNPLIRTPHLDRMAGRSARFTQFYVSPVCAPTRASLMTGRYNYRTRVVDTFKGRAMMEPEERTLAEALRGAGWSTGIFGKWHLGDCRPMAPRDQGFAESLVHRGGGIGQPSDPEEGRGKYTDPVLFHNGKKTATKGYCTDVYFDAATRWMRRCHAARRPFFAYIATNAPHGPFRDVPESLRAEYARVDLSNARFPQDDGHPLPERENLDRRARIYAMITNIDDNVGRLFAALGELGITRETIVLFLHDNGPNGGRYNAGMRGIKSSVREGGVRSPLFFHWPGRAPAGREVAEVAAHIDVMPTILDACGVGGGPAMDGRSLLPLLAPGAAWPDRTIYVQAHRGDRPMQYHNFFARSRRWKLLHASGFHRERFDGEPKLELYDMLADPLEMNDLAAAKPGVVAEMLRGYERWFDDVSRTRVNNWAPPRIHIGSEPVTVLTRQDRRQAGRQGGHWELFAVRAGTCEVRARFAPKARAGSATLAVGGERQTVPVPSGATECSFGRFALPRGPARLSVRLARGNATQSPRKVRVRLQ